MRTEHFELFAEFENQHWWFVGRQRIVHGLLEELGIPAGSMVVDLGCGTGANIASLSPTYRAVGIDPSPEAIELARSRFPNVDFICGSVSSASADAHFGASHAVILMNILEHVEDDFRLTAEFVGKMRVGAICSSPSPRIPVFEPARRECRAPTAIRPNAAGRRMGRPACLRSISIPLQRSSISHCPRGQIMESLVAHDDRACRDGQQAAWSSGELGANAECSPARDRSLGGR